MAMNMLTRMKKTKTTNEKKSGGPRSELAPEMAS